MLSHLKEKSTRETSTTRAVRPVIPGSQGLGGGAVCSLGRHQAWASTSTTSVPRAHAGAPVAGLPRGLSPVVLHSLRCAGRHKATEAGAPRRDFLYSRHMKDVFHTRREFKKDLDYGRKLGRREASQTPSAPQQPAVTRPPGQSSAPCLLPLTRHLP